MRQSGFTGSGERSAGSGIPTEGRVGSTGEMGRGMLGHTEKGSNHRPVKTIPITVGQVLNEFTRLSSVITRRIVTEEMLVKTFLSIVQTGLIELNNGNKDLPPDLVTVNTIVSLIPSEFEVYMAFSKGYLTPGNEEESVVNVDGDEIFKTIKLERRSLKVPNRVRRAVLYPLEPVMLEGMATVGLI